MGTDKTKEMFNKKKKKKRKLFPKKQKTSLSVSLSLSLSISLSLSLPYTSTNKATRTLNIVPDSNSKSFRCGIIANFGDTK